MPASIIKSLMMHNMGLVDGSNFVTNHFGISFLFAHMWIRTDLVMEERKLFQHETALKIQNTMVSIMDWFNTPFFFLFFWQPTSEPFRASGDPSQCLEHDFMFSDYDYTVCVASVASKVHVVKTSGFSQVCCKRQLKIVCFCYIVLFTRIVKRQRMLVPSDYRWKYAKSATGSHRVNLNPLRSGCRGTNPRKHTCRWCNS